MNQGKYCINTRQQVRPKTYKRKFSKAKLIQVDKKYRFVRKIEMSDEKTENLTGNALLDYKNFVTEDATENLAKNAVVEKEHFAIPNDETENLTEKTQSENVEIEKQEAGCTTNYQVDTDYSTTFFEIDCNKENMNSEITENDDIILPNFQSNDYGPNKSTEKENFMKNEEGITIEDLVKDLEKEINWKKDEFEDDKNEVEDEILLHVDTISEDTPVQPGHSLTIKSSVLLIWIYIITHSLTSSQVTDLLTIINLHLLFANPVLNSLYRFKNFFGNMNLDAIKHYYCSHCMSPMTAQQKRCLNDKCGKEFDVKNGTNYFIEMNIVSQLQTFFTRKDFREGLKHRFERSKKRQKNIEDIYDSSQYKRLFENNGPLSNPNNITFTFNTDGVPVFKSSKTSIWPVYLMINELPYKMRKRREYMILAGLWCGPLKPSMNLFLRPLFETIGNLEKGVLVTRDGMDTFEVRAFLLAMSCDIPARSAVLNINQHNGESCCVKCIQSGKNHRTSTGGNIRIFPYSTEDPSGPERTHNMVLNNAHEAFESKSTINGFKGPSVVMFCPEFDSVKSITIDYMHLVCLGVVRLLLNLWFNVSHSSNNFSLYRYVEIVDLRLEAIKLPHFINRQPRSISEHLKFWKAAELRSWLFYYSVPCIMDLIQPIYLYHFCALVEGVYLLCKSSISTEDIENSERLLQYFVFMLPTLYGDRYLTINVHSLLHLPKTVKELGPLWAHSCFAFEDANGSLMKLFHGTQYIDIQIINAVHVFQILPILSLTVSENSVAHKFVMKMTGENSKQLQQFSLLGKGYSKDLCDREKLLLMGISNGDVVSFKFYARASIRGVIYHSKDYTRVSKRNSYTVKFLHNEKLCYGFILWFSHSQDDSLMTIEKTTKYAFVQTLEYDDINVFNRNHEKVMPDCHISHNFMNISLPHLKTMILSENCCVVELRDIVDLCLCIELNDCFIICEEPNHHEKNL